MDEFRDHRQDPGAWAAELGVSKEAVELYLESDVIDLHVDSFIWQRLFRKSILRRHRPRLVSGVLYGQADLPRLREAQVSGATWVITTNPAREPGERLEVFRSNVDALVESFAEAPAQVRVVRTAADYALARRENVHAAFLGVQGGNAFEADLGLLDLLPAQTLLRVTLVHMTSSQLGGTSSPFGLDSGLGALGKRFVERLNDARVFVDLAHAGRDTFWHAVDAHDRGLPLLVSHTGVSGAHRHWRNLDDRQLAAVAKSGGVVGIMYHAPYLGDPLWAGRAMSVARHLEHVRKTAGEDTPALGSDWDGAIVTPRDMPTCLELPRLVQCLLELGWSAGAIQKALGRNFLRSLAALRG